MLTRQHNGIRVGTVKTTAHPVKRAPVGRPRSSALTRTEQLRLAKRAQRVRDGDAGQHEARLKLPRALAERLVFASRQPDFIAALTKLVDAMVVEVSRYPQLKLLCWNRRARYLALEDAWSLYERNWRFIDVETLDPSERELIESLFARHGGVRRG